MNTDRRDFLAASALLALGSARPAPARETATPPEKTGTPVSRPKLIAVEEAWACPEWMEAMRKLPAAGLEADEVKAFHVLSHIGDIHARLVDMDLRLKTMDEQGVDMHVLSLTAPGVQSFAPDVALRLARFTNDRLASIVHQNPTRYAALASVPPQDVPAAVTEIHRARNELRLNGIIINSHTRGEYLDDRK
jgi:predicted TIM-barrel fold metal-dependent hydrolase